MQKKVVIFDFDGVLIDTLLPIYSINTEVNKDLSIEEFKGFFEGNIHEAIKSDGTSKNYHPNFNQRYKANTRELKIPDVLKNAVSALSLNYILIIVSSTPTFLIQEILAREGISCFTDILGSDVHTSKVVKIKMTLEKYQIAPQDIIFITDTLGDVREANKCEVRSIAVSWGFHDVETLQKGNPAKIINDPQELVPAIEEIFAD